MVFLNLTCDFNAQKIVMLPPKKKKTLAPTGQAPRAKFSLGANEKKTFDVNVACLPGEVHHAFH